MVASALEDSRASHSVHSIKDLELLAAMPRHEVGQQYIRFLIFVIVFYSVDQAEITFADIFVYKYLFIQFTVISK